MNSQLEQVQTRVEAGIEWLTSHDPSGAFHLWYVSGIQPFSPMPAQDEERREEYRRYHKNRQVFERLWKTMEGLEAKGGQ